MTVTKHYYDAEASDLFAVLIDPETYPSWLVGTQQIRRVEEGWPKPGSSFKHRVGFGPISLTDTTTARDLEPPRMLELFVRARPLIEAIVRFDITPKAGGCLLRMTETPSGLYKIASPLTQPLIRARNERSLDRLGHVVARSRVHS